MTFTLVGVWIDHLTYSKQTTMEGKFGDFSDDKAVAQRNQGWIRVTALELVWQLVESILELLCSTHVSI